MEDAFPTQNMQKGTKMGLNVINDANGLPCFSGRELFQAFGLHGDYEAWIDSMKHYGFVEGEHFTAVMRPGVRCKHGEHQVKDHLITGPMSDELCLLLPTEEGHRSREDLLSMWYARRFEPEAVCERLAEMAEESEDACLLPNAMMHYCNPSHDSKDRKTYADVVYEHHEPLTITRIAEDYGLSAVKLNRILEDAGVQYRVYGTWRLQPDFADCGFVVREAHGYSDHEGAHQEGYRLKWTQTGRLFIYQIMKKIGLKPIVEDDHDD